MSARIPAGRDRLATLVDDVLAGRRRLVAWGARDMLAAYRWQLPLPYAYVVDADWQKWGTTCGGLPVRSPSVLEAESPDAVVVVVYFAAGRSLRLVSAFLQRLSLPFVTPFGPEAAADIDGGPADDDALAALALAPLRADREQQTALAARLWSSADGPRHWSRLAGLLAGLRSLRRDRPAGRGRAVLYLERLHLGGAERQLCLLALGLQSLGWQVVLATALPNPAEAGHYLRLVQQAGIAHRLLPPALPDAAGGPGPALAAALGQQAAFALWHVPGSLQLPTASLALWLAEEAPDLIVGYLDRPNLIAGLAGVLTGVPLVRMSARNLNPLHLPQFYEGQTDGFAELYRCLLALPDIVFSANSAAGRDSYAAWLGPVARDMPVIANAVPPLTDLPPATQAAARALLGVPADRRTVLGVFRLEPEKRPLLFLEIFARLRQRCPDLHGVLCGSGALEEAVRARIAALDLASALTLVPPIPEVGMLMAAADLLLHVAEVEGMPNVVLEAQAHGLPVVATLAGGTADALAPALRPFSRAVDDEEGLVAAALELLLDDDLRARLSHEVRDHIRNGHSPEALARATLAAGGADDGAFAAVEILLLPAAMQEAGGFGWFIPATAAGLPPGDDLWRRQRSGLRLYEDGRPLGPPHSTLGTVRDLGGGRFSHWSDGLTFSTGDGSDPRRNGRTYSVRVTMPSPADPEILALARTFASEPAATAAARTLALGTRGERAQRFEMLGHAMFDLGRFEQGAMQFYRAWALGRRRRALWHAIRRWGSEALDVAAYAAFLRQSAAAAEAAGDADWMFQVLLDHEQSCYRAFPHSHTLNLQDEAIVGPAARLWARHAVTPSPRRETGPLRIGYLLTGETHHSYSHHTEIMIDLVLAHDPAEVDARLIGLSSLDRALRDNPFFPLWWERLTAAGRDILFLDTGREETFPVVADCARRIAALDLDVLILPLQSGWHYALTALRPAPVLAGLAVGIPELYTSRLLDLSLQFCDRPSMESLCPSVRVPTFLASSRFLPPAAPVPRADIGVPGEALLLASSGRPAKFAARDYWWVVARVLEARPEAWLIVMGPDDLDGLAETAELPSGVRRRIRCLGWRHDHKEVLAAADLYLDTFPYGGGYTLYEAMSVGLPVIMADDDVLAPFDVRTWSPIPEVLPPDWSGSSDREAVLARLMALVEDPAARAARSAEARVTVETVRRPHVTAAAIQRALIRHAARLAGQP